MRRLEVRYDADARTDLSAIINWIVEQGADRGTAYAYAARIEARCKRIGLAPQAGRRREDLGLDLRIAAFEHSATIVYRVEPDRVLILRILRRGRDVERAFTP